MTIRLVIFDCDGVLVDSEELGHRVFAEVLAGYGHGITDDELAARFRGVRLATILDALGDETGIQLPDTFEEQLRQRMSAVFRAELQPVDGAPQLVDALRVPCCVASSGPRRKIEDNLQTAGLHGHFAGRIFSGYEVQSWKPDPGLFLAAAQHFAVAPAECVVIEDSPVGVSAGLAAGMTVLGLDRPPGHGTLTAAHRTFSSLQAIQAHLAAAGLARV